jgi:iron complex outermembrane recepter protein
VLINGNRIAPSSIGQVVDVSLIPLSAIDRVEVLADGSSAIYGSDAVAGVVNFILRSDYDGAETRVRMGTVTEGSMLEEQVSQLVGHSWDNGNVIGSLQFRHRDNLASSDRSFSADAPQPTDLLPRTNQISGMLNAHQNIGSNIDLFGDAFITHQDDVLKYAPTATRQQETLPTTDLLSLHGGVGYTLLGDWRAELSGAYSSEHTSLKMRDSEPEDGFTSGTVYEKNVSQLWSMTLKADGTVVTLRGGDMKAALGGSIRQENFSHVIPWEPSSTKSDRVVQAVYGELYIPLIGQPNEFPLFHRLDISAAVRYDHYSDFGGTTNPKYGVVWSPIEGLDLRGSYSTSFRAPNAFDGLIEDVGIVFANFNLPGARWRNGTEFHSLRRQSQIKTGNIKKHKRGFRLPTRNSARRKGFIRLL